MGEIADMMIDGTLCESCGDYIEEGEAGGFPRYCSESCAKDRGAEFYEDYNDNDDEDASIESIVTAIDNSILFIEIAIEDIKEINLKGKTKELSWLIKRLNLFKEKLIVKDFK